MYSSPAQWVPASAIAMQEEFSGSRISNMLLVLQLRRPYSTARITAKVLNLICGAKSVSGRRKIYGMTLSLCKVQQE